MKVRISNLFGETTLKLEQIIYANWKQIRSNLFEAEIEDDYYVLLMPEFYKNEWIFRPLEKDEFIMYGSFNNYSLTDKQFQFLKIKLL